MSNNFSNIYPESPHPKTLSNSLFAALLWQNVSQKTLSTKIGMACYPFARARGAFKAIVQTRRLDRLFKGLNHSPRYRYAREGHREPIAPPPPSRMPAPWRQQGQWPPLPLQYPAIFFVFLLFCLFSCSFLPVAFFEYRLPCPLHCCHCIFRKINWSHSG